MLRVVSVNVNGIRAASRKGFFEWLAKQDADVVCLQELKAQEDQLDETFRPQGYHCYFHTAEKKGYSGVAIYSRVKPKRVLVGLGWGVADNEGRYVQADFDDLSVASIYLPSGTSGDERQALKFEFLDKYEPILAGIIQSSRQFIICGDWNIAHKQIDLRNWKSNKKNSGFLPEERAWLDKLFGKIGFNDVFRELNQESEQYTWWSNRGQAWAKNVGWRIDYHVATPVIAKQAVRAEIYKDERFSDHAPLTIDYDVEL